MKITGARQDSFIGNPDPACASVLLYGPDGGLVRERGARLSAAVLGGTGDDPFRSIELTPKELKDDPARLGDEALALALGGGRRLVRLQGAGDGVSKIIEAYLSGPTGDSLLVIEAGELGPRSSLRKLFEKAANGAAIACYADDARGVARLVHETLSAHGLKASPEAMAFLTQNLGSDRMVSRAELEKLALYMGAEGVVTLEDARAAVGDNAATALDDACMAAAGGNQAGLDKSLVRAVGEGVHSVGILRAAARHFLRLHQAAGMVEAGKTAQQAMKALRPPVFFGDVDAFAAQMRRWNPALLAEALDLLAAAEMDCKTTGMPADAVSGRALMRIAQMAKR
ncbi:MAG: DNA polymerase III subunit delta [Rhodospirillaceae bacterium]|nr:DNA polymerase III subunit delta [Rhodospirillaceae bacterium]